MIVYVVAFIIVKWDLDFDFHYEESLFFKYSDLEGLCEERSLEDLLRMHVILPRYCLSMEFAYSFIVICNFYYLCMFLRLLSLNLLFFYCLLKIHFEKFLKLRAKLLKNLR